MWVGEAKIRAKQVDEAMIRAKQVGEAIIRAKQVGEAMIRAKQKLWIKWYETLIVMKILGTIEKDLVVYM